jgi:hypothetical protein
LASFVGEHGQPQRLGRDRAGVDSHPRLERAGAAGEPGAALDRAGHRDAHPDHVLPTEPEARQQA